MAAHNEKPSKLSPTKLYRFDARLNESQRLFLQRAADLEGRTLTDFVLQSAESAAARAIQERTMILLSARDSKTFVEQLLHLAEPSPTLRKAAKRYKDRLSQ